VSVAESIHGDAEPVSGYYSKKLSAERLRRCYEIAPPRVLQYLQAEIDHVISKIQPDDIVLELGCGYGRVLRPVAAMAKQVIGIDNSLSSLMMGNELLNNVDNCHLLCMNAVQLAFRDHLFDVVICIQNGISAFHVNQVDLIGESIRVTKPGGIVLFSSYSDKFWDDRLAWFQLQSEVGLLGEIDYEKTGNGEIVCRDGFTATTVSRTRFRSLTSNIPAEIQVGEVDESSLFCELTKLSE